jgi:hypothetical protein
LILGIRDRQLVSLATIVPLGQMLPHVDKTSKVAVAKQRLFCFRLLLSDTSSSDGVYRSEAGLYHFAAV